MSKDHHAPSLLAPAILLPAAREHLTLSSTILREVIKLGGDVTPYVPTNVAEAVARLRA